MRLNAPKVVTWVIAVVAILVGIILYTGVVKTDVDPDAVFWLTAGGGILACLGALLRGL